MTHASVAPPGSFARLRRRFAAAPVGALVEIACRAGYLARGVVYVSVGVIALLALLGRTPEAEGPEGALIEAWARWPVGLALLWFTGVGLYAFAGWRALQSLFDADRQGRSAKALASRAGQAISGVVHAGLAISVFGILDALEDLREPEDEEGAREAARALMELPYGSWLVIAVGGFILAVGVGNILEALFKDFRRDLAADRKTWTWAAPLARLGYAARGVAFLPAGALTMSAGLESRAAKAQGLGGALEVLRDQPFGPVFLGFVAAGLIAFGLYAFVEARYRPMRAAECLNVE